ncbi:hypothetical protein K491DRAFT_246707 [Lophiostoma macrostomum CBS 122681]|uniref:Uncharacterized protein n=1 Tax=Lophiostoma macrostomum CBS 122681 TaxID=1314788 RepID=A0A6A6TFI9_9PLEO|nr:hypothetical protein K491DRAFT_246707 [Lophiostoma macrostomum CBS 122681]
MPSPRRVDESSQFSRIDRRSIPRGYASAMPAEEQRPKRDLYAAALNDQDHTSNRSRLVYRNEYPSYEATHGSMFSRLHNREPMARPRIPPQNEVIELTSSPQRPSSSGRHERYAPAHPYATTLPNHRPRIPDSHREYNTHGSEHLPPVEYVTRSQHAEPSHVYTRAAVSDESRYTGSVPQYGRRDLH